MSVLNRWKLIREMLNHNEYVTVQEFTEQLGISEATIRRDLSSLEEQGLLERFRGGARKIKKPYQAAYRIDKRMEHYKEEKIKIAKKAAELIQDGDYIFMDSSTTVYYMIDYITAEKVTVVTNAIPAISKLMDKGISTYVLNGFVDADSNSILGEDASEQISKMRFNKSFIGTYGMDAKSGFSTYDTRDGAYKKNVVSNSEHTYVLADHSKFEKNAFYIFASLEECTLITDEMPEESQELAYTIMISE